MPDGILGLALARRGRRCAACIVRQFQPPVLGARGRRRRRDQPPLAAARPADAACRCAACASRSRGVHALDGVDLDVREGEILGVLGPNGSGKSTLINVVSGHYRADAGSARFEGVDLPRCPRTGSRAPALRAPTRSRGRSRISPFATTSRWQRCSAVRRSIAQRANEAAARWLRFTGLAARADALSGRSQPASDQVSRARARARRESAAAAARRSAVGPHAGGDRRRRRSDPRIRDQGTTIVLVEHVMRVVTALSDRIVVLDQGRVLAEGSAADVMARSRTSSLAYLGRAHA